MEGTDPPEAGLQWPELRYADWRETAATLQLWTQIVGKVRVACTPWLNHSWHVVLQVTATGLATPPIAVGDALLDIEFDFVSHALVLRTSRGGRRVLPLEARPVSAFYRDLMAVLDDLGVPVAIDVMPN